MANARVPETVSPERPRWLRWLLRTLFACLALAVLGTPWWGPSTLARLDYFHVRRIQFEGVRYANTSELIQQLALDSTASIWDDLDRYSQRIQKHPMVQSAEVTRTLPATVVVNIVERLPVALMNSAGALSPVDAMGHVLPINTAENLLDAPIVSTADSTVLHFLDALRVDSPKLYARVIEVRRTGKQELWIQLKGVVVRCRNDVTPERLGDILRVEESLAQQNQHAVELDLRFQDQVIARLP